MYKILGAFLCGASPILHRSISMSLNVTQCHSPPSIDLTQCHSRQFEITCCGLLQQPIDPSAQLVQVLDYHSLVAGCHLDHTCSPTPVKTTHSALELVAELDRASANLNQPTLPSTSSLLYPE
ncbi:MAG: hypothetical protein MUF72_14920 [Elainella sp. Prado103]|nr:hypothetical protein [Elainella sp. Prado103]